MSYPLTPAQRRFQKIKRADKHRHIVEARQEKRDEFANRRKALEEAITAKLEVNGHTINETVIKNLATRQAIQERKEKMQLLRWERKYGAC